MKPEITMSQVKSDLVDLLFGYGFYVERSRNGSRIIATCIDNVTISFDVMAGTARKFDVYIKSSVEDFLVPHIIRSAGGLGIERFDRTPAGIRKALIWISGAVKSHKALWDILDEGTLDSPYKFIKAGGHDYRPVTDLGNRIGLSHGILSKVFVHGIVTLSGRDIKVVDCSPDTDAWFLVELWPVDVREKMIITDGSGENWYPVHAHRHQDGGLVVREYRVVIHDGDELELTEKDLDLMNSAITQYTERVVHADA